MQFKKMKYKMGGVCVVLCVKEDKNIWARGLLHARDQRRPTTQQSTYRQVPFLLGESPEATLTKLCVFVFSFEMSELVTYSV